MRKFFTILSAILAFASYADASVTLQECRDKARENYPLVRRYDLIRATKECNVRNASLSWLNIVTDAKDLGDILGNLASMVDLNGKKEQPWHYQAGAPITQNIWDGGARHLFR